MDLNIHFQGLCSTLGVSFFFPRYLLWFYKSQMVSTVSPWLVDIHHPARSHPAISDWVGKCMQIAVLKESGLSGILIYESMAQEDCLHWKMSAKQIDMM